MANTVTETHIKGLMESAELDVKTIFGKVTVVTAKFPNGFTVVESSACVDPSNYSEEIGKQIVLERIENKLWELEGYLLQNKLYNQEQPTTTLKEQFVAKCKEVKVPKIITVAVQLPSGAVETITNTQDTVTKALYYTDNYDENFCLKHNNAVKIVDFMVI